MTETAMIRQPAVAGMFYPADPLELRQQVRQLLEHAAPPDNEIPVALIVPHAGYIYSGPVAATAYLSLLPIRERIRRVILLGPSHRVPFHGIATSQASEFLTPLGSIRLDHKAIHALLALPGVQELEAAHSHEHSLEVQLPFLQNILGDFVLVPLVVGDCDANTVASVIEPFLGDPSNLILISSDMSHYHDYTTAKRMDNNTARAIETLNSGAIDYDDACGRNPILGMLEIARRHGLVAHALDLRNSGDTAGPRDQVVGYGAFSFTRPVH